MMCREERLSDRNERNSSELLTIEEKKDFLIERSEIVLRRSLLSMSGYSSRKRINGK